MDHTNSSTRSQRFPEQRTVVAALEWLGGDGSVSLHDRCWEVRGGSPSSFVEAPSAVALSCLQIVLDEVKTGLRIELAPY